MTSTNINVRIDSAIKANAESILSDLGLNLTSAINVFLIQVINTRSIPFDIKLDILPY